MVSDWLENGIGHVERGALGHGHVDGEGRDGVQHIEVGVCESCGVVQGRNCAYGGSICTDLNR